MKTVAVGLTGASGAMYGLRLVEVLVRSGSRVQLMITPAAHLVIREETAFEPPAQAAGQGEYFSARFGASPGQLVAYGQKDWYAPPASGSNPPDALVVCPCTSGTLAAIAAGTADTLLTRAADVMLKERRNLILVPRETPFSQIHLENMLRLARAGALVLPANPGFYHRPSSVDGVIDFVVARVLDQLGIAHDLLPRWGGQGTPAGDQ